MCNKSRGHRGLHRELWAVGFRVSRCRVTLHFACRDRIEGQLCARYSRCMWRIRGGKHCSALTLDFA